MTNFIPKLKEELSPDGQDGRLKLGIREKTREQHQELEGPLLYAAERYGFSCLR